MAAETAHMAGDSISAETIIDGVSNVQGSIITGINLAGQVIEGVSNFIEGLFS